MTQKNHKHSPKKKRWQGKSLHERIHWDFMQFTAAFAFVFAAVNQRSILYRQDHSEFPLQEEDVEDADTVICERKV